MSVLARILAVAALGLALSAAAQSPSVRIRGDVVVLEGNTLQVKSRTGEVLTVKLADNFAVSAVAKRDFSAVARKLSVAAFLAADAPTSRSTRQQAHFFFGQSSSSSRIRMTRVRLPPAYCSIFTSTG